jgi:hypothetical protein
MRLRQRLTDIVVGTAVAIFLGGVLATAYLVSHQTRTPAASTSRALGISSQTTTATQRPNAGSGLPTAPPGCLGPPGVTSHAMDRRGALASVSGEVKAQGGTVSTIVAKLMTYDQYLAVEAPDYHFNGVVVPGQSPGASMRLESPNPSQVAGMSFHANDPVWVVAFSGRWFPQGGRGGLGASPSGIVVMSAKVGLPIQYKWFAGAWPPGFNTLPDAQSLPCVPS